MNEINGFITDIKLIKQCGKAILKSEKNVYYHTNTDVDFSQF